jgi:hypothetical protein
MSMSRTFHITVGEAERPSEGALAMTLLQRTQASRP